MARTRTTGRRGGGRAPTAAAPRMGHTCWLCPDRPSVLADGEPGDPAAAAQAREDLVSHLRQDHPEVFIGKLRLTKLGEVSLRTHAGPTVRPALPAAA